MRRDFDQMVSELPRPEGAAYPEFKGSISSLDENLEKGNIDQAEADCSHAHSCMIVVCQDVETERNGQEIQRDIRELLNRYQK